jgi:hypothetical protein
MHCRYTSLLRHPVGNKTFRLATKIADSLAMSMLDDGRLMDMTTKPVPPLPLHIEHKVPGDSLLKLFSSVTSYTNSMPIAPL